MVYADYICELNRESRRDLLQERREISSDRLSMPVATWVGTDRLHNGPGWEFVVILRTVGCKFGRDPRTGCTMCGYLNDAPLNPPTDADIRNQFIAGFHTFLERTQEKDLPAGSVVFKIFTSGSFFDHEEVPFNLQDEILSTLAADDHVAEIAVESRPEYVNAIDKEWVAGIAQAKHLDVGVGLEAVTDLFRDTYIQKGFSFADFMTCHEQLQQIGAGTKVYLTLKPPFVSESVAIAELVKSIRFLIDLGVDTISINPVAVQKNTLVESLFKKHLYRPPWLFSVLMALEEGTANKHLDKTRILCAPIAAGKGRGAHNCNDIVCSQTSLETLREAIAKQNFTDLVEKVQCQCKVGWLDELAIL
ncbi:MAG TPA: archaeosine biosynthesis radical SAM protein RaSEA [Candidatus Lokiarchaeia archaeon]|nr:archaeosine biosynthesis radical SAM protein RaSEA [Candidatus Lokiarchaeia archaeon]